MIRVFIGLHALQNAVAARYGTAAAAIIRKCHVDLGNGVHLIRAKERVPSSSLPEEAAVPRPSTTCSLITVN